MYKNPALPKLLTPSQKKFQSEVFDTVRDLVANNGYIKGYGKQDRLMTGEHVPLRNIDRKITVCLKDNELLSYEGMIYTAALKAHTITKQEQIKL